MTRLNNLPMWAPTAENEVIPPEHTLGSNRGADAYVIFDRTDTLSAPPSRQYIEDSIAYEQKQLYYSTVCVSGVLLYASLHFRVWMELTNSTSSK